MRFIIVCTVLLLSSCGFRSPGPIMQSDACSLLETKRSWNRAVNNTSKRWNISPGLQLSFILTESNFRPRAKTPKTYFLGIVPTGRLSSAFGYAQAIDSTWKNYQKSSGNRYARRTNFSDSVDFIGWYTNETTRKLNIPKSDVFNQYLAYHQGHKGYSKGAYKNKKALLAVANRTDKNARKYNAQLKTCH